MNRERCGAAVALRVDVECVGWQLCRDRGDWRAPRRRASPTYWWRGCRAASVSARVPTTGPGDRRRRFRSAAVRTQGRFAGGVGGIARIPTHQWQSVGSSTARPSLGDRRLACAKLPNPTSVLGAARIDQHDRSGRTRRSAPARDPVPVSATVALTDGEVITLDVLLPDLASLLGLKLHARRVRQVDRDAIDLWTCLELLASAGEMADFAAGEDHR